MALRALKATSTEIVEEELEYKWYIINTYTSMENRVKKNIEIRAKNLDLRTKIVQVLVPTLDSSTVKNGRHVTLRDKMFPGYILVYMQLTNDAYECVRGTTGVVGFVSTVDNPEIKVIDKYVPITLSEDEITRILDHVVNPTKTIVLNFEVGTWVQVIDGPLDGYMGLIERINTGNGTLNLRMEIMGAMGSTQVPVSSVEKI